MEASGIELSDTWEITAIGSVYSYTGGDHSRIPGVILYARERTSASAAARQSVFVDSTEFLESNRIILCMMHNARDNERVF